MVQGMTPNPYRCPISDTSREPTSAGASGAQTRLWARSAMYGHNSENSQRHRLAASCIASLLFSHSATLPRPVP